MFLQTTMSPWFPSQNVCEIVVGSSGPEMSRMLNPSQFPWYALFSPEGDVGLDVRIGAAEPAQHGRFLDVAARSQVDARIPIVVGSRGERKGQQAHRESCEHERA